jgi:hypothetical protein
VFLKIDLASDSRSRALVSHGSRLDSVVHGFKTWTREPSASFFAASWHLWKSVKYWGQHLYQQHGTSAQHTGTHHKQGQDTLRIPTKSPGYNGMMSPGIPE